MSAPYRLVITPRAVEMLAYQISVSNDMALLASMRKEREEIEQL